MRYDSDLDKFDRPLTPEEYLLALIWEKDITYEPNEKKKRTQR